MRGGNGARGMAGRRAGERLSPVGGVEVAGEGSNRSLAESVLPPAGQEAPQVSLPPAFMRGCRQPESMALQEVTLQQPR